MTERQWRRWVPHPAPDYWSCTMQDHKGPDDEAVLCVIEAGYPAVAIGGIGSCQRCEWKLLQLIADRNVKSRGGER